MDHDPGPYALPGGGRVLIIGSLAIVTEGRRVTALCRTCGRELASWRAGEVAPQLRCGCLTAGAALAVE